MGAVLAASPLSILGTEGVANLMFNNFSLGVPPDALRQYNNTFQIIDNVTKVFGKPYPAVWNQPPMSDAAGTTIAITGALALTGPKPAWILPDFPRGAGQLCAGKSATSRFAKQILWILCSG